MEKKTARLFMMIEPSKKEKLNIIAHKNRMNMSHYVQMLIDQAIEQELNND